MTSQKVHTNVKFRTFKLLSKMWIKCLLHNWAYGPETAIGVAFLSFPFLQLKSHQLSNRKTILCRAFNNASKLCSEERNTKSHYFGKM